MSIGRKKVMKKGRRNEGMVEREKLTLEEKEKSRVLKPLAFCILRNLSSSTRLLRQGLSHSSKPR
jgi:hypothetical protein